MDAIEAGSFFGPRGAGRHARRWRLTFFFSGFLWLAFGAISVEAASPAGRAEIIPGERSVEAMNASIYIRFLKALGQTVEPVEQHRPPLRKPAFLATFNAAVNRVPYRSDTDLWGEGDRWSSPREFFLHGGDCEDYAIAKYAMLRRLGYSADTLRLVVLYDRSRREIHAGLAVRAGSRTLFLDNVTDEVRAWAELGHYAAVYSVNEQGLWLHLDSEVAHRLLFDGGQQPASR